MPELRINWAHLQNQLDNAAWGESTRIVNRYARRLGVSRDKVYRELRKRYGPKKTIDREAKVDPDNKLIKMIRDIKYMGESMQLKERELSTKRCIEMLIERGMKGARSLTVSTVNRRLREMGYREAQPTKRIESRYANQVHMIDFSRSKYFQLFDYDAHKDDYMLVVSGNELHYKQGDKRLRTWIVQYLDDYSRLRKIKAYPETQESAFLGLDHLSWVWGSEADDEHLFRYLPLEMLRSDNGAFRKAQETKSAMESLGVNLTKQLPKEKGGTAKIERGFRSMWESFELPLAVRLGDGNRIWLSEYNELLYEFTVKEHEQEHPVYRNYTKGEFYQKSLADRSVQQLTTDVDVIRLACRVEKRKVDGHLRVSLNSEYYSVPQYVNGVPTIGKQIYVHENKYGELTGKLIGDLATDTFELEPWEPAYWGEFESFKQTEKTKLKHAFREHKPTINEIVEGDWATPEDDEIEKTTAPNVAYMRPDTKEVEPDSVFSERIKKTGRVFRSELDARAYIGTRVQAWGLDYKSVAEYFTFDQMPVTQHDLDQIINRIGKDYDSGKIAVNY